MARTTAHRAADPDPAESQPATRRDEILAVAASLFASRGYHGTSMRDIATALGMRAPSLYKHVRSKDSLLEQIVDGYLAELLPRLERAAGADGGADGGGTGAQRLAAMVAATVETGRAHLDPFLTLSNDWNQIRRSPALEGLRHRTRAAIPLWLEVIRTGMADGTLRPDIDPARTLRVLIGSASSMVDTRFDDIDDDSTMERTAVVIDTLLLGLTPRSTGS